MTDIDFYLDIFSNIFNQMNDKDAKLKKIITDFSRYIAIKISEYSLSRYGIFHEDIFQDIYVKLWKSIDNGRKINHLPAYIRKTINSVIINQILSNNKIEKSLDSIKQ
jgi:DNA-directed RNA polymerase specialized sigma24 family protein